MKKQVISFFLLLVFCNPLYCNASPKESIDLIVKMISEKDFVAAEELVDQFLKERLADIWYFRALYLKGHISENLFKPGNSIDIYLKLLSEYPQLKDYTLLNLAGVHLDLGEESKSFELFNRLLKEFPQSRLHPYAKFFLGKLYFNRDDLEKASSFFTDIINNYPESDLVPESMFFAGVILEKQGKIINSYETFIKLFHFFPLSEFALEAEDKIREIRMSKIKLPEIPPSFISKKIELLMKEGEFSIVSRECKKYLKVYNQGPLFQDLTFKLARIYSFSKKRKEALRIYTSFITKHPFSSLVPEALYNIANIFWNQGKHRKAVAYAKKVIKEYPDDSYAEKAYYVTGRIFEQGKKYREAISQFQKMAKRFPHGSFAVSAHWHIGWINYITGNYHTAANKFAIAASRFHDSSLRDQFLYWAGKSYEKTGETAIAHGFYNRAAKEHPYDYYGHRGKVRLSKKSGNKVKIIDPFFQRELDADPIYTDVNTKMSSDVHFHFVRIKELIALGYYDDALEEIRFIARKISINTPEKIFWLGNLYIQAKGYNKSLRIVEGFFQELSLKKQLDLPLEYWKLFFPIAYRELVVTHAKGFKLDPLLIQGLMRQESSFDPDSLSKSGAIGLMQLMPETGKHEFRKRYKDKFYEDLLYKSGINISLGSQHLAHLLKKAKGDPIIALAGYNAGLSRALKWQKTLITSDPDVFIEMIPFRETKRYIKKVLRNYFNYIILYGDGEEKDKALALNAKDL